MMTLTAPRHPGETVPVYDVETKEPVSTFHAARPLNVHRDRLESVPLDALVYDEGQDAWYLSKDLEEWDPDMEVWYIEPDRDRRRRFAS